MKLAALVSSGKDSLYATYLASKRHEIRVLVAINIWNEKVSDLNLARPSPLALPNPLLYPL